MQEPCRDSQTAFFSPRVIHCFLHAWVKGCWPSGEWEDLSLQHHSPLPVGVPPWVLDDQGGLFPSKMKSPLTHISLRGEDWCNFLITFLPLLCSNMIPILLYCTRTIQCEWWMYLREIQSVSLHAVCEVFQLFFSSYVSYKDTYNGYTKFTPAKVYRYSCLYAC